MPSESAIFKNSRSLVIRGRVHHRGAQSYTEGKRNVLTPALRSVQLLAYLKLTKKKVGLHINFKVEHLKMAAID